MLRWRLKLWLLLACAHGALFPEEEVALARGKTALVTGAAGFIGSHVARHCSDLGMRVLALDDLSGGFRANVPEGVTFIQGDIRDAQLLERIFNEHEVHYVYHLAAYAAEGLSHFIRSYNYRTNLVGSVEILNQAIKHRVHCFVFTSSIAVYGSINDLSQMQNPNRSLSTSGHKALHHQQGLKEEDRPTPEDPYGIAKFAFELDLQAAKELFGIDFVIFRPHNVYGPHQNMFDKYRNVVGIFINQIFHGQPLTIFGSGEQLRAFSYIDDVAPILARGPLQHRARNEIFNVGADVAYSVARLGV
ncbi:Putative UDP-glucose 4-epimerase (Galactowaldenase) (UDP-galactose 4-epimerase) [Durusdinium trenchii]|uniref:UDP-glucose 4-epimerase (Galactowaldenase) (UDP-galactose 4-epimerase) n=1 Tax=Durusdinium trenchii TaxID=1381693 RepID=A0ABP0I0F1_9DINO